LSTSVSRAGRSSRRPCGSRLWWLDSGRRSAPRGVWNGHDGRRNP
jgi:hypothetical protein